MSEPVREGKDAKLQVFDREAKEATFEGLKDLVNKFLSGEQGYLNVKFNPYLKFTQNEFNELLGDYDYGGYEPTNTLINGALIYKGAYTYVDDNEVVPNRHIMTTKVILIFFHKEKNNGATLYAIHQIKGLTWAAGIKVEDYDEYE